MEESILKRFKNVLQQYYNQFDDSIYIDSFFIITDGELFCQNAYLCKSDKVILDSIELFANDEIRFRTETHTYAIVFNWLRNEIQPFVESIIRQQHIEPIYYDNRVERRKR